MKLRYTLLTLFVICVCGFMLTSCGEPPDTAIIDAEDAIKTAIAAGADADSPKLLDKARTLLQEAKMYSEQGDDKNSRNKAITAKIVAEKATRNSDRLAEAYD